MKESACNGILIGICIFFILFENELIINDKFWGEGLTMCITVCWFTNNSINNLNWMIKEPCL